MGRKADAEINYHMPQRRSQRSDPDRIVKTKTHHTDKMSNPVALKKGEKKSINLKDITVADAERLLKQVESTKKELPHLYGWPWYPWAKEFFDSRNAINLLCAGNQLSKSATLIRKNIEWACNKKLWQYLWTTTPRQFWYFYPNSETATREYEKKWKPEYLPKGDMAKHEWYGWTPEFSRDSIKAIHFKSGVTIYFMYYSQKVVNLQTSTVHMVSGDEEMPESLVNELLQRVGAVDGYFNLVFTATLGQALWYKAMECIGQQEEVFPYAFKKSVSINDCRFYIDGSPSPWTPEKIKRREQMCTSEAEKQKRLHGRFVHEEGRRFAAFTIEQNVRTNGPVPPAWKVYGGVDMGTGGGVSANNSKAAIVFIAVNKECTKARVIFTWRGDKYTTTAHDIISKYREYKQRFNVMSAAYDHASGDFGIIAARLGEPFVKADKTLDAGFKTVNLLFQAGALTIDEGEADNHKLITELMTVPAVKKRGVVDDLSDALRYAVMLVPWNYGMIDFGGQTMNKPVVKNVRPDPKTSLEPFVGWTEKEHMEWEVNYRRGLIGDQESDEGQVDFENEIEMWNEMYG